MLAKSLAFCVAIGFTLSAYADSGVNLSGKPIYVVDMQKVLTDSIAGKAARNDLEAEAKKSEAKLERARLDMKAFQESVAKQQSLLSGSALEQKRDSLVQKERDLQRLLDDEREALDRKKASEIRKIVLRTNEIIKSLAKDKGYDLIVEKDPQNILFVDPKFDITSDVLAKLDKEKLQF